MTAVLAHPLWWPAEQRLQLLIDVSDRCGRNYNQRSTGRRQRISMNSIRSSCGVPVVTSPNRHGLRAFFAFVPQHVIKEFLNCNLLRRMENEDREPATRHARLITLQTAF